MGLLDSFEKGLERAVNSAFAKSFRSGIQPVEIAAALRSELDAKAAVVSRDRILAPNAFEVRLAPADAERMRSLGSTLDDELLSLVQKHAKAQGFSFAGPVTVALATDEIEARPYMEDLIDEIGKATEGRPIAIALEMDAIRLPGRDAVSFVVIVNELVTNAIKHAFVDGAPGRITIRFDGTELEGKPALRLCIEDDGVGMSAQGAGKGLGQTVIASLLRSMRATMSVAPLHPDAPRPGTCVTLIIPKREPE